MDVVRKGLARLTINAASMAASVTLILRFWRYLTLCLRAPPFDTRTRTKASACVPRNLRSDLRFNHYIKPRQTLNQTQPFSPFVDPSTIIKFNLYHTQSFFFMDPRLYNNQKQFSLQRERFINWDRKIYPTIWKRWNCWTQWTACTVACGQGSDVTTSPDGARFSRARGPETLESARK